MKALRKFLQTWLLPPGITELISRYYLQKKPSSHENSDLLAFTRGLANRHQGERCFILGAGSSINSQDLTRLSGEKVISVSNTFVHPDYSVFSPIYHVLPPLLAYHGHLNPRQKWLPWLKEMDEKIGEAEMLLHIGDRGLIEQNNIFTDRKIHWCEFFRWDEEPVRELDLSCIPSIGSVSELALTLALYLGFDSIYLLGFDHDWFNGPQNYFYNPSTQHAMKPNAGRLAFADAEFQMRRHARIFRKYKFLYEMKHNIYNANANKGHYLDVFPRVDYDALFSEADHV